MPAILATHALETNRLLNDKNWHFKSSFVTLLARLIYSKSEVFKKIVVTHMCNCCYMLSWICVVKDCCCHAYPSWSCQFFLQFILHLHPATTTIPGTGCLLHRLIHRHIVLSASHNVNRCSLLIRQAGVLLAMDLPQISVWS